MVRERLLATVSMAFSLLALLLTAIGLHGLLSPGSSAQARELAIRVALGASVGCNCTGRAKPSCLVGLGAIAHALLMLVFARVSVQFLSDALGSPSTME